MTAFSSGLKVLMISAKGTEEKERGQGREKGTSVKVCRDKKRPAGGAVTSYLQFTCSWSSS